MFPTDRELVATEWPVTFDCFVGPRRSLIYHHCGSEQSRFASDNGLVIRIATPLAFLRNAFSVQEALWACIYSIVSQFPGARTSKERQRPQNLMGRGGGKNYGSKSNSRIKVIRRSRSLKIKTKVILLPSPVIWTFSYVCESCTLSIDLEKKTTQKTVAWLVRYTAYSPDRRDACSHIGKYDTLLGIVNNRKARWSGHDVVRSKRTLAHAIVQTYLPLT